MKHFFLPLALIASAGYAFGAPVVCAPASVASYITQNEGCTLGLFTLKNFAWSSVSDDGYVPVSATEVFVTPGATTGNVQVSFNSSAFEVFGNDKILAFLDYVIDPAPPILDDLDLSLDANSPVAPGNAKITADLCIGDFFINSCRNGFVRTLVVQNLGDGNPANVSFASVKFPRPVNLVDVRTTIELNANGASSQIDGYGTTSSTVPEPGTALAGAVAVALLLAARRLRFKFAKLPVQDVTEIGAAPRR